MVQVGLAELLVLLLVLKLAWQTVWGVLVGEVVLCWNYSAFAARTHGAACRLRVLWACVGVGGAVAAVGFGDAVCVAGALV